MSAEESKIEENAVEQNDEWIVQAKPRRLVPQHSLSRQDLEADKSKPVPAATDVKKKVIRFTKEEMMTFRQPAKILSTMVEMTDVISLDRLNPVCFERFEPEDVIKIWNTDKTGPGSKGLDAGRGRGRGKPREDQTGEHVPGDWSTAQSGGHSSKGGLWDDSAAAGSAGAGDGMDLSDFAAMALKFRSEMEQMKLTGDADGDNGGGVDMMTLLASEQSQRAGGGGIEDEDEELPDWANDDAPAAAAPQPAAKRSLLLDTLNVKRPVEAPAPVAQQSAASNYSIGGGLDLSLTASVHTSAASAVLSAPPPPPLLRVEPNEWLYTDPQGQVQGPFEQDNMRQWHEAGYFNADLPIKLRHWQRFHAFHLVFADLKSAFLNVPQEPGSGSLILNLQQQQQQQQAIARQQQLLAQQQAEEQRKEQERAALEAQRQRQAQMEAAEQQRKQQELQRQQQEQQRQQQLALQQQQAQQILLQQQHAQHQAELEAQRALLEQQQQQAAAAAAAAQAPSSPTKPATVAPWANNKPGPNRGQDLASIQNEEAAAREAERKRAAAAQATEQARAKGWTAPAATGAALSLAEIQQQEEEARQRQQAEAARNVSAAAPATTNMSSQLKNLLGVKSAPAQAPVSTGPAWGTGAAPAQAKSAASLRDIMQQEDDGSARPAATAAGGRKPTSWAAKAGSTTFSAPEPVAAVRVAPPAPTPVHVSAPAPVAAAKPVSPKPAAANSQKEKSSFGGKDMSKDMADWCSTQLRRISGSEVDLTLVQFCMSLDSAADIRETLSSYLGSSPAVTNFATEFIKYKETGKRAVESTAASAGAAGAGGNSNNPSNFVSANKKKGKAPGGK